MLLYIQYLFRTAALQEVEAKHKLQSSQLASASYNQEYTATHAKIAKVALTNDSDRMFMFLPRLWSHLKSSDVCNIPNWNQGFP